MPAMDHASDHDQSQPTDHHVGSIERVEADDPRLDPYRALRDPDLVRAGEGRGWFIGEQALVLERMLARPGATISILASAKMAERAASIRDASPDRAPPIYVADDVVLEAIVRSRIALGPSRFWRARTSATSTTSGSSSATPPRSAWTACC
jgi:hypothetical protein